MTVNCEKTKGRVIFHIDANSAYLSWTAADMLNRGYPEDLRQLPAVIAGDPESRQGIILAKSPSAKRCGISTGESLFEARQKCPELQVYPPDYELYMNCSQAMYDILTQYSPIVQRYSIDECFLDGTKWAWTREEAVAAAEEIKNRIARELGFTVNVGVGPNKLLAKMAGELRKPDQVITIWEDEVKERLWPLPVRELYMVGRATERKLKRINIETVGSLAQTDPAWLKALLKSHGVLIHQYANGVDETPVIINEDIFQKGVGNSTTMKYDMTEEREIHQTLLALCEKVGMRLRRLKRTAALVSVSVKAGDFIRYSHQKALRCETNSTTEIYRQACLLFHECWRREPVRQLGVSVSELSGEDRQQLSLFQTEPEKELRLNRAVDDIRNRFGETAVIRGSFANGEVPPLQGGVHEGEYIMMGGYKQ